MNKFLYVSILIIFFSCGKKEREHKLQLIPATDASVYLEGEDFVEGFRVTAAVTNSTNVIDPKVLNFRYENVEIPHLTWREVRNDDGEIERIYNNLFFDLVGFEIDRTESGLLVHFNTPNLITWENFIELQGYSYLEGEYQIHQINENNIELDLKFFKYNNGEELKSITISLSINKLPLSNEPSEGFIPRKKTEAESFGIDMFTVYGNRVLVDEDFISRFNMPHPGEMITFWLENFPPEMVPIAIEAVETWNDAFDRKFITAKVNEGLSKVGNRNFNVMQWTDEDIVSLGYAGPVYTFATGEIYASHISINGAIFESMKNRLTIMKDIGRSLLDRNIVPEESSSTIYDQMFSPFIDLNLINLNSDEITRSYYHGSIIHEVGHALGFRHNFKGSIMMDEAGDIGSIMDYHTPSIRQAGEQQLGSHDIAAVRWAILGEEPKQKLISCDDADAEIDWQCNTSDFGDPLDYLKKSLKDSYWVFMYYDEFLSEESFDWVTKTVRPIVNNYLKLDYLIDDDLVREEFKKTVQPEWGKFWNLQPKGEIAAQNWDKVKRIFVEYIACIEQHGWDNRYRECFDLMP